MRKATIGSHHYEFLTGYNGALQEAARVHNGRADDLESVLFGLAFQAGVNHFVLPTGLEISAGLAPFLEEHATFVPDEGALSREDTIKSAFCQCLPADWLDEYTEHYTAHQCMYFLKDLFFALSKRAVPITLGRTPTVEDVKSELPLKLALPIANLLSALKPVATQSLVLGAERFEVGRQDVARVGDLLSSKMFKGYSEAHSALDDASRPIAMTLADIKRWCVRIADEFRDLVAVRTAQTGVLDFGTKLVGAHAGKGAELAAEMLARLANEATKNERRIVVHDYHGPVRSALRQELHRIMRLT